MRESFFPFIWIGAAYASENVPLELPEYVPSETQDIIKFLIFFGLPVLYREYERYRDKKEQSKKDR